MLLGQWPTLQFYHTPCWVHDLYRLLDLSHLTTFYSCSPGSYENAPYCTTSCNFFIVLIVFLTVLRSSLGPSFWMFSSRCLRQLLHFIYCSKCKTVRLPKIFDAFIVFALASSIRFLLQDLIFVTCICFSIFLLTTN